MQAPLISIIIPSRAQDIGLLQGILDALVLQTIQDLEILIVCDRKFEKAQWTDFEKTLLSPYPPIFRKKIRLFSTFNSDFQAQSPGGASAVRNYGIQQAQGKWIQLFDDDNRFHPTYLATSIQLHKERSIQEKKEVIITPTLLWRNGPEIQNQGFSDYNYRLARPQIHFLKAGQTSAKIKMFSGNGIFGKAELIKATQYDEEIARIAEDLEFVYRLSQKAYILTFSELQVHHMEREKNILEQARIGTPQSAHQKIKNTFLWVKKHGNLIQTLIFLLRSSWGISVWLSIKALKYGNSSRRSIIKGIRQGYLAGWKLLTTNKA